MKKLMYPKSLLLVPVLLLSALAPAQSKEIYAAPHGTPTGDGSKASPLDVFTVLGEKSPAQPGDVIYFMGGRYDGKMDDKTRVPFESLVSGSAEKPIKVRPVPGQSAHLNGTVVFKSSYVECRDLDIGDLQWDPTQKNHITDTALNAKGGTGSKIINCNIFGGLQGVGAWSPAVGLEVYGSLIHDFGYFGSDRGHGHAYYAQNEEGTKLFANNIAYRGAGWNVHVYTERGQIKGFDILSNICYIAGAQYPDQTTDNYLVSGYPPADRIRMIGNVGYQPSNINKWRPNARFSTYDKQNKENGSGELRDNYLMGAPNGILLSPWRNLQATGNTVWAYDTLIELSKKPAPDARFSIDKNTYISNAAPMPFKVEEKEITFDSWKALGWDRNSRMVVGKNGKPTGTKVFVYPNKYSPGRANIGVFNWDGHKNIAVDLAAVLRKGQKYSVYNCLDIKQTMAQARPVLTGSYNGKQVNLPMRKAAISPDFDAFLVVPVAR